MSARLDDEARWVACEDGDWGHLLRFPARRLRRFVAVEMVGKDQYRARVFVGWHADPKIRPSASASTYAAALAIAEKGARKMGVPLIQDRYSVAGHGVWSVS